VAISQQGRHPNKPKGRKRIPWIRLIIATIALTLIIVVGVFNLQASLILGILGATFTLLQWLFPIAHSKEDPIAATPPQIMHPSMASSVSATEISPAVGSTPNQQQSEIVTLTKQETASAVYIPSESIFHFSESLTDIREYYGRLRERTALIGRVRKIASTSIVGPRRIGKTWLMSYLRLTAPTELGPNYRIGYLDASGPLGRSIDTFARKALEELGYNTALLDRPKIGLETLEQYLEALKSQKLIPVLCIDEFEGFGDRQEFDLAFFKELRSLTQTTLCLVVASKNPLIDIIGDDGKTSGFFNVFEQLTLKPFSHEEAEAFAEAKSRQAGFTDQEKMRLLLYGQEAGKYYPLRLQLAGKMLLEDKNLASKEGSHYYHPDDLRYWQEFEERLKEKYRGVVR